MGTRCANHVTPLYPQKLALTSPTGGGRSVGMVRSRTKATEFSLVLCVGKSLSPTSRPWFPAPNNLSPVFCRVACFVASFKLSFV